MVGWNHLIEEFQYCADIRSLHLFVVICSVTYIIRQSSYCITFLR